MPKVEIIERGRPLGGPLTQWIQFRLVPWLGSLLVKCLSGTFRLSYQDRERVDDLVLGGERVIFCFYHRRLFNMYLCYPYPQRRGEGLRQGLCILSSDSKDGERSAATWRWFGVHAVRGTAGERGAQALVRMIHIVKQGWDLAITVDGPRGPRQKAKGGVISVSRRTGAWLVPVSMGFSASWILRSWDAMVIPKPFSRAVVRYGKPFRVEAGADEEGARLGLEQTLDALEVWADHLA